MSSLLTIDHDSLIDNDRERQVEFTAEVGGEGRDFAIKYAILTELSGDEPEGDALELSSASAMSLLTSLSRLQRNNHPQVSSSSRQTTLSRSAV